MLLEKNIQGTRNLCFTTFFLGYLQKDFDATTNNWQKRKKVFEHESLLIPLNITNKHWILVWVKLNERKIVFVDSLKNQFMSNKKNCAKLMIDFLREREKIEFLMNSVKEWNVEFLEENVPQQNNGSDCGVFLCLFTLSIFTGKLDFPFSQEHINNYRKQIFLQILQNW